MVPPGWIVSEEIDKSPVISIAVEGERVDG